MSITKTVDIMSKSAGLVLDYRMVDDMHLECGNYGIIKYTEF